VSPDTDTCKSISLPELANIQAMKLTPSKIARKSFFTSAKSQAMKSNTTFSVASLLWLDAPNRAFNKKKAKLMKLT